MIKLFAVVLVCYLLVMAITYFNQRSLIYHPSQRGLSVAQTSALGLQKWPSVEHYRAYLVEPEGADKTFVLFHGNAGEAVDRMHYLVPFARENARILLAEYPGFGSRPGTPSEDLFVPDAIETLTRIADDFPEQPIYVFGESLGSGIASAALGRLMDNEANHAELIRQIKGLGLITPFDSLVNVAQRRFRYLPVRWLIKDRYNSVVNLQKVRIPKALILSGKDLVVPIEHGQNLAAQLQQPGQSFTIDAAGHSNWMDYIDQQWWDDYFDFLLQRGV